MRVPKAVVAITAATIILLTVGCEDEEARLLRMAEKHARRQAEQSRQIVELQREVAQGTRELVKADSQSRQEMVSLQRDLGRQQDELESDRRALAAQRHIDPIVAGAITTTGLLLACMLPLVLCWYLLHRGPDDNIDAAVSELLIQDLVSEQPLLQPPSATRRSLACPDDSGSGCDSEDEHSHYIEQ